MARIERFEDLIAWQKTRELTKDIYFLTRQGSFSKDRNLCDQIQRAAISVMSNIAEGFERGKPKEFDWFLSIAKASCAEVKSQIYIAHDIGYLDKTTSEQFIKQTEEIGKILGDLRKSIQNKPTRHS